MMVIFSPSLLPLLVAVAHFAAVVIHGATLAADEVTTLREIAKTMGKTDWNFTVDPCSGELGWKTSNPVKSKENAVNCDCSFSGGTVCHVTSIMVKAQNLSGTLPAEIVKLPYLIEFDVTRNYLNGTIPVEWGMTKLLNISLLGNRLTGKIPKELGNISTLQSFVAEYNQLSGVLPPELGNLTNIQRFFLSSNYFTGELPTSFAKLTSMKDFRIPDNNFTGKIPDFIGTWTNLTKLVIQGSGLTGPIPSGFSQLKSLTDLRISDLSGNVTTSIPSLNEMGNLEVLILSSCNIIGELPDYLYRLTSLQVIDLSFNNLTGGIPASYIGLYTNLKYIYLTANSLTGTIPDWMTQKASNIDLSYNNFSVGSLSTCQNQSENLFRNPLGSKNSGIVPCVRSRRCSKEWYSLNINSGGKAIRVGKISYEDDTVGASPAAFHRSSTNWALSSTGNFLDGVDTYTLSIDASSLSTNTSPLYADARLSPLSLTYYGYCLGNGNYTVNLHFAEIQFTDDETYSSLGRRIFDVYIQGELRLKDFDIAMKAGGVYKGIVESFFAMVEDNTLEIRFHWSGKGTNAIPSKGIYGPLISAISVTPNFRPPSQMSTGAIVGIVLAVFVFFLLAGSIVWCRFFHNRHRMAEDLKGLDLQTGSFTLRQIKAATNNFNLVNKIGEGGFGSVYKGYLADGTVIAVKQLSSKSKQGNREFVNEIGMISALEHPHLVRLYGCCVEGKQLSLVYEYMENNSLARALFDPQESHLKLDWPTRQKICVGIARGLAYLHEESTIKIVHRDIKATNVLLDKDLNPKISDFGLAKLDEEDKTHMTTRIAGTYGYMAPEYAMRGHLTDKADVYSFGIVALEIVSGQSNTSFKSMDDTFYLLDWALVLKEKGQLMDLVDPKFGSNFNKQEALVMIKVGLLCTNTLAADRPSMSSVVSMLEGHSYVPEIDLSSKVSEDKRRLKGFRETLQFREERNIMYSEVRSDIDGAPWTNSSTSDLYAVDIDSDYWDARL